MAGIGSILIDGQDPSMPALRAFLANLDGRVSGALAQLLAAFVADQAVVVYAARSSLYGNLTPGDRALGIVYNDGANNGVYIKNGAAGSGSWNATGLMLEGQAGEDGRGLYQIALDTGFIPAGATEAQFIEAFATDFTKPLVSDALQELAGTAAAQLGEMQPHSGSLPGPAFTLSLPTPSPKTGRVSKINIFNQGDAFTSYATVANIVASRFEPVGELVSFALPAGRHSITQADWLKRLPITDTQYLTLFAGPAIPFDGSVPSSTFLYVNGDQISDGRAQTDVIATVNAQIQFGYEVEYTAAQALRFVTLSQAEYDALTYKDPTTLYVIP